MTFIGVATTGKDEDYIIKTIEKNLKDKSIKVISINNNSIENIKNVKFETIIVDDILLQKDKEENVKKQKNKETLKKIINNSKNIILNSDIIENLDMVKNLNLTIITYGFNSKATITMSSLNESNMLVCLQRNIKILDGRIVEQQEVNIELDEKKGKINNSKRLGMLATSWFYNGEV